MKEMEKQKWKWRNRNGGAETSYMYVNELAMVSVVHGYDRLLFYIIMSGTVRNSFASFSVNTPQVFITVGFPTFK